MWLNFTVQVGETKARPVCKSVTQGQNSYPPLDEQGLIQKAVQIVEWDVEQSDIGSSVSEIVASFRATAKEQVYIRAPGAAAYAPRMRESRPPSPPGLKTKRR